MLVLNYWIYTNIYIVMKAKQKSQQFIKKGVIQGFKDNEVDF